MSFQRFASNFSGMLCRVVLMIRLNFGGLCNRYKSWFDVQDVLQYAWDPT